MARAIGVPCEIKDGERRVAIDPSGVRLLTEAGLDVRVESGAGAGAGFPDDDFAGAGGVVVSSASDVWAADLVVKVKEPQRSEYAYFRPGLRLFAYLHLAAEPDLALALTDSGVEAHAFETISDGQSLPVLAPMSEIAGRAAAIIGAFHLSRSNGTLLGGAAGVPPARVVVIGLGVAGTMAARGVRGLDAEVLGVDIDLERLRDVHRDGSVTATLASQPTAIGEALAGADVVIGAALVPGARAPTVIRDEHVAAMTPGSVLVDLAIDQGGCSETSRPTRHSDPTYEVGGVVHYCVTNVPALYPRTASRALSAVVAPRVIALERRATSAAIIDGSLNIEDGRVVHPAVADALDHRSPLGSHTQTPEEEHAHAR